MTFGPNNLTIPAGQLAAFECNTAGSKPRATVSWYKDSTLIISNATNRRIYISGITGTLMIREVQESDEGVYHCIASNVAGTETSKQARLSVVTEINYMTGMYKELI